MANFKKSLKNLKPKTESISWTQHKINNLETSFADQCKELQRIMSVGGGINNIHIGALLRDLHFLYLNVAAHREALYTVSDGKLNGESS